MLMPRSGLATARACTPAAVRRSITPFQPELSANAPWTNTTVVVAGETLSGTLIPSSSEVAVGCAGVPVVVPRASLARRDPHREPAAHASTDPPARLAVGPSGRRCVATERGRTYACGLRLAAELVVLVVVVAADVVPR